jgi:nucleotide-binding universal stress UspA family protein
MPTAQIEAPVAIHKILFATDFTEASRKAFKYTKALARHFEASVTTAHVMRASARDWPKFRTDPEYQKLCRETKQMLDRLSRQLHQAGFEADSALLDGDPVPGILKAVKHHKADLLVLGTHGSRDLERFVLGSTAEEILRKASCPGLTVGQMFMIPIADQCSSNIFFWPQTSALKPLRLLPMHSPWQQKQLLTSASAMYYL